MSTSMDLLVIGSEQCGKSQLVNRYFSEDFTPRHKPVVVKQNYKVPGRDLNICVYDVCGSLKYRPRTPPFYRGSHACIICIDPTDQGNSYATPSKSFGQTR